MDWQLLVDRLTLLRDSWPSPPWSWDSRFSTIASSFDVVQEPQVRTCAMLAFPRGWTTKSLESAPEVFRTLAQRTGMRATQRLLAGDEMACPTLYGLWWPWGGGDKITLRIGILDANGDADPLPTIRELFGVVVGR